MKFEILSPEDIEKRSLEIIEERLGDRAFKEEERDIIKRVIHTSADFDYADSLEFSENAVREGVAALRDGAHIVTDTNMAYAGINKKVLSSLGGAAHCFMADEDVAQRAKLLGTTRASVSMEKACSLGNNVIFAIGNAPTALIKLDELIRAGKISPRLIIGVPVGFVNVTEAKKLTAAGSAPYIISRGNKGGSAVAAAICNALLYKIKLGKR